MPSSCSAVIDAALESTIVASWSRLGYQIRSRMWSWESEPRSTLNGRVVLLTGGTRGIGRASAIACARAGAHIVVVGRTRDSADRAAREISEVVPAGSVSAEHADIGILRDVEELADRISERFERLDAIVHAAGQLFRERGSTIDGTEMTAAVHVVGPHLLTARLKPLLEAGAPSVAIWVSSGGMYARHLDVRLLDRPPSPYRGAEVYARAKRAQVELARLWTNHLAAGGVSCASMHPGWVDTDALKSGLPRFASIARPILRTPDEGADTINWLIATRYRPKARSGIYLDRIARSTRHWPMSPESEDEAQRLWRWCNEKTGLSLPGPVRSL